LVRTFGRKNAFARCHARLFAKTHPLGRQIFAGYPNAGTYQECIDLLELKNSIVTIDAAGTLEWKGLQSLVRLQTQQTRNGKTTQETRYYLSSLPADAKSLLGEIRKHWSVENNLHWSLDVSFNEHKSRVRDKNAALAMAALRRFAWALLKNIKISKSSIKLQRLEAAWNNGFLLNVFKLLN